MARISKIQIQNYRSIKDSGEIPITKLFAVIGKNNTGKSAFLKAIQILLAEIKDVETKDFHRGGTPLKITGTLERWIEGELVTNQLEVCCENDGNPKLKYKVDGADKTPAAYKNVVPPVLSIPDRRDSAEFSTAGQKTTILKKILTTKKVVDEERLAALKTELEDLKRKEAEELSKILTQKFRQVTQHQALEVKIEPEIDIGKSTTHSSSLMDGEIEDAPIVGLTESGTGVQSLYLLTLLDTYGDISDESDDAILIIEEPEVYLHPAYQRCMFDSMRKIASENQVIFSTHSPIMISQIWVTDDYPSVRQIRIESGETIIEPVDVGKVISELGIRYEDVLNPKLTIFVEGEGDEAFYRKLGISGSNLVYIPTDGFKAMHYFAYMKIISSINVSSSFTVIADSDGATAEERVQEIKTTALSHAAGEGNKLKDKLEADGSIYILGKYSIESYFINKQTLSAAFPEINDQDLDAFINHYNTLYESKLTQARDDGNPLTIEQFRKFARPKLIFSKSERKSDSRPEFETAYNSFWDDSQTFIAVRNQIVSICDSISISGTDWFEHVLNHADLNANGELTSIRDAILAVANG